MNKIFDRHLLKKRKNNIPPIKLEYNFVKEEIASRILEKINEVKKDFSVGLDLGCGLGEFAKCLIENNSTKINTLIQADLSINFLTNNHFSNKVVADAELIPFKEHTFDIVISILSLHNVNRLENTFKKIYTILKSNGVFLCVIPTVNTLSNIGQSIFETEMLLYGGASPHIHPFSTIQTIGNLIQTSGFNEIVSTRENIDIMYKDVQHIFRDLKTFGETNILYKRNKLFLKKDFFNHVITNLKNTVDTSSNHYPIPIEFCTTIAWKE